MNDMNSAVKSEPSFLRALQGALVRAVDTLLEWREVANQRRALLELDDCLLRDIGISRADAVREAKRPFWDHRPRAAGNVKPESRTDRAGAATVVCCQR